MSAQDVQYGHSGLPYTGLPLEWVVLIGLLIIAVGFGILAVGAFSNDEVEIQRMRDELRR